MLTSAHIHNAVILLCAATDDTRTNNLPQTWSASTSDTHTVLHREQLLPAPLGLIDPGQGFM